jgi:hypothetical protein
LYQSRGPRWSVLHYVSDYIVKVGGERVDLGLHI